MTSMRARGGLAIIVVWDGLRPDFVTPEVTPHLHRCASEGAWFEASHCAFPSETRVNAAALTSGCYPGRTGITGNTMFVPGFDAAAPAATLNTGDHTQLARLAEIDAPLVDVPTLPDAVVAAGGVAVVASSGSPGAALLQNPRTDATTVNHGLVQPAALRSLVYERFGPPPADSHPATGRSDWMTRALLEYLLPEVLSPAVDTGAPAVAFWWLTDPDHTAHSLGLGAPETVESLRQNDRRLEALTRRLAALGLAESTNVLLTSDHGFSTAGPPRRLEEALLQSGLRESLAADDLVLIGGSSGAVYFHDRAHDRATAVVRWLQGLPWMGAILARDSGPAGGVEGVLPLSAAWGGRVGRRAPDIRFGPAWTSAANVHGVPGAVAAGGGRGASHGSASPFDMRNSLFGWGPGFKQGLRSQLPAGIVDVAPTVRHLLGLPAGQPDGRVLLEALRSVPEHDRSQSEVETDTRVAVTFWPGGSYRQQMHLARVGQTWYLDGVDTEHG